MHIREKVFIPSQFPPLSLLIRNKQFLDPYLNNKQFSLQFSGFVSVGFMSRFMHTCMATPYANVLSHTCTKEVLLANSWSLPTFYDSFIFTDGDTDGTHKGKRYMYTPSDLGKFFKLIDLTSVLDPKVNDLPFKAFIYVQFANWYVCFWNTENLMKEVLYII